MRQKYYEIDVQILNMGERELIIDHLREQHRNWKWCWIAYVTDLAGDKLYVYEDNLGGIIRFMLDNFTKKPDIISTETREIIEY